MRRILSLIGLSPAMFWIIAGIAVFISASAAGAAWFSRGLVDSNRVNKAEKAQLIAERDLNGYIAKNEGKRADANADTLNEVIRLGHIAEGLRAQLDESRAKAAALSARLSKALTDAPASDVVPLGPAIRRYLDSVRLEAAAGTAPSP
jgi:hypothetical protein